MKIIRAAIVQFPLVLLASTSFSAGWGSMATISNTEVGYLCNIVNNPDRVAHDIDCNTNNPYVDSSGNVGIGTTSPDSMFDVAGTIAANKYLKIKSWDGSYGTGFGRIWYDGLGGIGDATGFLSFGAGTNDQMIIKTTGNVGIGTTNPLNKLHLASSGNLYQIIESTSTGTAHIWFKQNSVWAGSLGVDTNGIFGLSYGSDGIPELAIVSSGNVGIGTVNPQSKLEVAGTVSATAFSGDGSALTGIAATVDNIVSGTTNITANNSGAISFTTNNSEAMVIDASGNVGIGTIAPANSLTVVGDISATTYYGDASNLTGLASADTIVSGTTNITANNSGAISFTTNGSEAVVIDASGNVGIGTTNPSGLLEVEYALHRFITSGNTLKHFYNTEPYPRSILGENAIGVAGRDGLSFTSNGYDAAATHGAGIDSPSYRALALYTSNGTALTERMHIDGSGNVGIGTTDPQTKLEVDGTISSTGVVVSGVVTATSFVGDGSSLTGLASADTIVSGTTNITANNDGAIFFTTAGTERMVVDSSGNVGIGTTAPTARLNLRHNGITGGGLTEILNVYGYASGTDSNIIRAVNITSDIISTGSSNQTLGALIAGRNVGSGTVTNAYGVQAGATKHSTGVINNAYALWAEVGNHNATGAITNAYGLYIADSTETGIITNDYGVYQVDTAATNYFGGNVGIGTTTPQTKLEVAGTISATGLQISGTAFATTVSTTGNIYASEFWGDGSNLINLPAQTLGWYDLTQSTIPTGVKNISNTALSSTELGHLIGLDQELSTTATVTFANLSTTDAITVTGNLTVDTDTLYVDSTNNRVGVGTTTPNRKLEILDASGNHQLRLTKTAGTYYVDLLAGNGGQFIIAPSSAVTHLYDAVSTQVFNIWNGATQAIKLNSGSGYSYINSGNVGIGTTTPQTKLEVAGTISSTGVVVSGVVTATSFVGDGSNLTGLASADTIVSGTTNITANNDGAISFTTAGTERVVIDSSGNVGIGTTSPAYPLDALTSSGYTARFQSSNAPGFVMSNNSGDLKAVITYDIANKILDIVPNEAGSQLRLRTSGTERLLIDSSGNVGIGTTAPQADLDVRGARGIPATSGTTQGGIFRITPDDGGSGAIDMGIYSGSGNGWLQVTERTALGTNYNLLLQPNGGNVGIGTTSPQATLDVSGTIRLAKNTSQPATCSATNDGAIALTSNYTLCACKGGSTSWVRTDDGTTACTW